MSDGVTHEVAGRPLQLSFLDMEWGGPVPENDQHYKQYCRLLRSFTRMAWQSHTCSFCDEGISPGEWYWCEVWVSIEDGKKRLYVFKKHDPVCPRELRDEEEMVRRENEREERAARRKAA